MFFYSCSKGICDLCRRPRTEQHATNIPRTPRTRSSLSLLLSPINGTIIHRSRISRRGARQRVGLEHLQDHLQGNISARQTAVYKKKTCFLQVCFLRLSRSRCSSGKDTDVTLTPTRHMQLFCDLEMNSNEGTNKIVRLFHVPHDRVAGSRLAFACSYRENSTGTAPGSIGNIGGEDQHMRAFQKRTRSAPRDEHIVHWA